MNTIIKINLPQIIYNNNNSNYMSICNNKMKKCIYKCSRQHIIKRLLSTWPPMDCGLTSAPIRNRDRRSGRIYVFPGISHGCTYMCLAFSEWQSDQCCITDVKHSTMNGNNIMHAVQHWCFVRPYLCWRVLCCRQFVS